MAVSGHRPAVGRCQVPRPRHQAPPLLVLLRSLLRVRPRREAALRDFERRQRAQVAVQGREGANALARDLRGDLRALVNLDVDGIPDRGAR